MVVNSGVVVYARAITTTATTATTIPMHRKKLVSSPKGIEFLNLSLECRVLLRVILTTYKLAADAIELAYSEIQTLPHVSLLLRR